jgi:hypothetical protein
MKAGFLRRPRRLSRPVAVVAAAVVGLGGLGGAAGALLGELSGAGVHRSDGRQHDDRFTGVHRLDNDDNREEGAVGAGPLR